MVEEIEAILTEIEDWGRALLAEHEKRACEHQAPSVQSSYVGNSLLQYGERLRSALNDALLAAELDADPLAAHCEIEHAGDQPQPGCVCHPAFHDLGVHAPDRTRP